MLVVGKEVYALSASDLFFRWNPEAASATLFRVHHPLPDVDPEISPSAQFGGYPPVQTPEGIVAADDTTNRFLAVLSGPIQQRWHLDSRYSFGVPASADGVIYTGMGGQAGSNCLTAIDSSNGSVIWTYAPDRLVPDRQTKRRVFSPKSVYIPIVEDEPGGTIRGGMKRVRVKDIQRDIISVPVMQPQAVDPFAHWKNGGIVITKERLYAEVGHSIVALDRKDGTVRWKIDLPERSAVRSLVGTAGHLVYCISNKQLHDKRQPVWQVDRPEPDTHLVAVDLKEGKEVWREKVPRPGTLAVANGRLFFADGSLHVFGPRSDEPSSDMGTH